MKNNIHHITNGNTMNTMKTFCSIPLLVSMIIGASIAQAGPPPKPANCVDMPLGTLDVLVTLCTDTENSSVPEDFKNPADRDNLVGKVVAASYKMAQGKPCDAYQKIRDYETKLDLLALTVGTPKAKIAQGKLDQLYNDLNAAMDAIAPIPCQ